MLYDVCEVNKPLVFEFLNKFFLFFTLRLARDGAEETAGGFFESFDGPIGKCVAFFAPKIPANVARHIFGVEFQAIQHDPRGLHHIIANSVTRHPRNFVFRHVVATLSASVTAASSESPDYRGLRACSGLIL